MAHSVVSLAHSGLGGGGRARLAHSGRLRALGATHSPAVLPVSCFSGLPPHRTGVGGVTSRELARVGASQRLEERDCPLRARTPALHARSSSHRSARFVPSLQLYHF